MRENGEEYLVFPATSLWWLTHYREFAQHLESKYRLVAIQEGVGAIFALGGEDRGAGKAEDQEYALFKRQLQDWIGCLLPAKSTMVVISHGDPDLIQFEGLIASHFPRGEDGGYAGHHPADSASAIAELESARAEGAEYVLVPQPSAWWLEYYSEFREHLERCSRWSARQKYLGYLYTPFRPPADV